MFFNKNLQQLQKLIVITEYMEKLIKLILSECINLNLFSFIQYNEIIVFNNKLSFIFKTHLFIYLLQYINTCVTHTGYTLNLK